MGRFLKYRFLLVAAMLAAPVVGLFAWSGEPGSKGELTKALWGLVAFLVVAFLLLEAAGSRGSNPKRNRFGYFEIALGADGRFSTSKTVAAAWTVLFASALVLLSGMVWSGAMTADEAFGGDWDAYFLLLGGPFASAVLAKGITSAKAAAGDKTVTDAASSAIVTATGTGGGRAAVSPDSPGIGDLSQNDVGELSLSDTQYWVFSLVAALYFVGALVTAVVDYAYGRAETLGLPPIPAALLGLTSLGALTYVGAKQVAPDGV